MTCPICSWLPNDPDYLFLYETKYWRAVLAPNQSLVGTCVVHLKRHAGDLADLTPEEMLELLELIRKHEQTLKQACEATMFNWSCYMNHAYRNDPPEPHVHWWAVPRYNHVVKIKDWVFSDPQFGNPYSHERWQEVPSKIRKIIAQNIQEALGQVRVDI